MFGVVRSVSTPATARLVSIPRRRRDPVLQRYQVELRGNSFYALTPRVMPWWVDRSRAASGHNVEQTNWNGGCLTAELSSIASATPDDLAPKRPLFASEPLGVIRPSGADERLMQAVRPLVDRRDHRWDVPNRAPGGQKFRSARP